MCHSFAIYTKITTIVSYVDANAKIGTLFDLIVNVYIMKMMTIMIMMVVLVVMVMAPIHVAIISIAAAARIAGGAAVVS